VPWSLRVAAAWSGRLLVVAAAVYVTVLLLARVRLLTLAMAAALLLAALLYPIHRVLHRARLPTALAALGTILVLLGTLSMAGVFVWNRASSQFDSLRSTVVAGLDRVRDWLVSGPLGLRTEQIDQLRTELTRLITDNRTGQAGELVGGAQAVLRAATGVVLTLFVLFFLLKDGDRLWGWLVRLFTPALRETVDEAGRRGWAALTSYVRGTVVVAFTDAVLIGIALLVIGVPLVLPLTLLTFLGAFVPLVGATLAGAAAVLVALVTLGPVPALVVLAAVVLAQQIEGNILQPLVLNRALRIHPLPLAAAVTAGALFAGIAGAVIAVPLLAVCYHVGAYLAEGGSRSPERGDLDGERPRQPPPSSVSES
jgi:predicted PurR-regulated permease PerM